MSVKIRLRRMGAKHQPSYRIVIADSRSPRDGRYIDQVGFYNPLTNPAIINVNKDKAIDWLRRGAEPTDTVAKLFTKFDIDPAVVRKSDYVASGADASGSSTATATQVAGDAGPTE
jgi:small subunit ribosomal protein S16